MSLNNNRSRKETSKEVEGFKSGINKLNKQSQFILVLIIAIVVCYILPAINAYLVLGGDSSNLLSESIFDASQSIAFGMIISCFLFLFLLLYYHVI